MLVPEYGPMIFRNKDHIDMQTMFFSETNSIHTIKCFGIWSSWYVLKIVFNSKKKKTKTKKKQEAFGERRHLHVCDLWHVIVTFSLSQELLDYLIKCYPVDKYNFDLSL